MKIKRNFFGKYIAKCNFDSIILKASAKTRKEVIDLIFQQIAIERSRQAWANYKERTCIQVLAY